MNGGIMHGKKSIGVVVVGIMVITISAFVLRVALTGTYPFQARDVQGAETQPYERLLFGDNTIAQTDTTLGRSLSTLSTEAYDVWWAPCTYKIVPAYQTPQTPFNFTDEKVVRLARNETRCFQVALTPKSNGIVPAVSITTSNSTVQAEASLQAFVTISEPSYSFEQGVRYEYSTYTGALPDPLIPWSFNPYTGDDPDGDGKSPSLDNLKILRANKSAMTAGQTRALLVEVTTNKSTPAGAHTITLTIGDKTVAVPMEVYGFTIPDRPTFRTALGTGSFNYNYDIGKPLVMHGVSAASDMKKLVDDYYHEALASFRLAPYTPTWTVSMVESAYDYLTNDSEYNCTTDVFQLRSLAESLLTKFLNPNQTGSGYLKGKRIPPYSNWQVQHPGSSVYTKPAGISVCGINWDDETSTKLPGTPNWEWALGRLYTAMQRYLTQKGWSSLAQINIDEPFPAVEQDSDPEAQYRLLYRPLPLADQKQEIKRIWRMSKMVIEKTSILVGSDFARILELYDFVDDRLALTDTTGAQVPGRYPFNNPVIINDLNQEVNNNNWTTAEGYMPAPTEKCDPLAPPYQKRCLRASDKRWFYLVFDPMFQADAPAVDHILPTWMAYKYGFEGFVYWSINWWAGGAPDNQKIFVNPWVTPKNFTYPDQSFQNLVSTLWYPPCGEVKCPTATNYIINSLRLPFLRESILDYEYMKILEAQQGRQAVLALTQLDTENLVRRTSVWRYDPTSVAGIRHALASAITGNPAETPAAPTPTPTSVPQPSPTRTPTPTTNTYLINPTFEGNQTLLKISLPIVASPLAICNIPAVTPLIPFGGAQTTSGVMTRITSGDTCQIGAIAANWKRTGSTSYPTRYDLVRKTDGTKVQQVITNGNSIGVYQKLPLTAGKKYRIEADVFVEQGKAGFRLKDNTSAQNLYSTSLLVKPTWQKLTLTVTDATGYTNAYLYAISRTTNTIFYIDNVKVTQL